MLRRLDVALCELSCTAAIGPSHTAPRCVVAEFPILVDGDYFIVNDGMREFAPTRGGTATMLLGKCPPAPLVFVSQGWLLVQRPEMDAPRPEPAAQDLQTALQAPAEFDLLHGDLLLGLRLSNHVLVSLHDLRPLIRVNADGPAHWLLRPTLVLLEHVPRNGISRADEPLRDVLPPNVFVFLSRFKYI